VKNVTVLFTNAKHLGFRTGSFDIAVCGFMGWDDCFDFVRGEFTQPDAKAKEVWRVLRHGGRFVCCSWDKQEDLSWMEEAMLRHYPAILENSEYLERRPIGMAHEKAEGYEVIFRSAGFSEIEILREAMTFVSTDEEEWWRQMQHLGWDSFTERIEDAGTGRLQGVKEAIFKDLQPHKQADGIHFDKAVFFVCGVK
jgi:ubiquinone/menaquinone biosynthesis C-methylase UbiE